MSDEASMFAMQLMSKLQGNDDITLTSEQLHKLSEHERRFLGRSAAKNGWTEYRHPGHHGVVRLIREAR